VIARVMGKSRRSHLTAEMTVVAKGKRCEILVSNQDWKQTKKDLAFRILVSFVSG